MRVLRVLAAAKQGIPKAASSAKKKTPSVLRVATGIVVSKPAQTQAPRSSTRTPRKQDSGSSSSATQPPAGTATSATAGQASSTGATSNNNRQQSRPRTSSSSSSSKPDTPPAPQAATSTRSTLAASQLKALTDVPRVDLPVLPLTWVEFQKATSKTQKPSAKAVKQRSAAGTRPRSAAAAAPAKGGFGYIGKGAVLRLFRYAVEREPLEQALEAAGLADEVELVEEISLADAVVSVKATRSGKHVNIGQGERTAVNAGVPFIVLGRKVSAESLSSALRPIIKRRAKRQAQEQE